MKPLRLAILIAIACSFQFVTVPCPAAEPVSLVSHIRHEPVISSALASTGYNKRRHILEIEFCNGALYRYLDVPPSIYREFLAAESKARYYDSNIKGNFRALLLRAARTSRPSD